MKQALFALLAGALFGAGLALSGMADPAKVRGFLDIFGAWNPTLMFVMGGALIPMGIAWRIQAKLLAPLAAERFNLPDTTKLDARLISGAVLFGIGWGVAGLCPGPAITDLALAPRPAFVFVLAMLAGMLIFKIITSRDLPMKETKTTGAIGK
ncbi:MAG: YeeE/YedE family protein [Rhodospirillales bacterium]|nr:YeeE/YedE family protein [Rhodospirillales bacterium]